MPFASPQVSQPSRRRDHPVLGAARALLAAAVAVLALAASAAPAGAAGAVLDPFGADASIAVDDAGTGHLAWYTQTGASFPYSHFLVYCQLPRGESACAKRTPLPTPGNLDTFDRSQVLIDRGAGKLHLLASLAGDNVTKGGTWVWTSTDGGTTFAAPVRISSGLKLSDAVLGPGPFAISTIGEVPSRYHAGNLDGSSRDVPAISLGAGVKQGTDYVYSTVGMLNSSTPFVVLTGGGGDTVLRRYDSLKPNPVGGPNGLANWLPAQQFASQEGEPSAAGGPSGAFVATTTAPGNPAYKAVMVRRVGEDGTIGAPANVSAGAGVNPVSIDLAQDAEGRLHTVYLDIDRGGRLTYQWSKRGETWGIPQVIDGPDHGYSYNELGVAPDGGGWVVNEKTSSQNGAFGQVHVVPLDAKGTADPPQPPAPPTATPTPTGPPVPPPPACPQKVAVSPAADAMVRSGPCFTDLGKGRFRTTGTVRVAGIDFVSKAGGGAITIDTKEHTVSTSGGAFETRAGSVLLAVGPVSWDLDGQITIADLGKVGTALLGFALQGKADLTFANKEARIHVWMALPSPFDGVRGETTVRTTMTDGLRLDDVHLRAESVPIGPISLNEVDLLFTGGTNRFEGSAKLTLPPAGPGDQPSIVAKFGMEDGAFRHLDVEVGQGVPPLPLTLFATPPVLLTRIGFHASDHAKGFRLAGGIALSLGPELGGSSAISVRALPSEGHGAYLFVPKAGAYAQIGASGTVNLADFELGYGSVDVRTDGPVQFKGGTKLDMGVVTIAFDGSGGLDLSNGDFYGAMKGTVDGFDAGVVGLSASASAIISSIGFAACGTAKGNIGGFDFDESIGYDRPWGGDSDIGSCNLEAYKPAGFKGSAARARRLQAGPTPITLGSGHRGVLVRGAGATPGFTLAGPGGRAITVPVGATAAVAGPGLFAVPTGKGAVEVRVTDGPGAWTLTPASGGPAVAEVLTAGERPRPRAKAVVTKGPGTRRRATITTSNLGGQTLTVRELLPGGAAHELGTVRKAGRTTLAFTPSEGPGGRRALEAVVAVGTRQVEVIRLGSYVAPAPTRPKAPRSVALRRTKTAVTARWSRVAGAASYRVQVKGSDGRLQVLPAGRKTTQLAIPGVTPDDRIDVRVSALDRTGRASAAKAATSKGKALPKPNAKKTTPAKKKPKAK